MNHWCESCARKNLCYVVDDRPKCFVPITNTASGTPYLVGISSISRDNHEIAKTEPQTDGYMTAEQAEDYRKMLDKAEHKVYGNIKDEPQTEREGEWIEGKYDLMCSNCENTQEYEKFPYCPYCGAKMADRKTEPQTDNSIGCSKCESRFWCMDRDMPHAVHCNNYGKVADEPQTDCSWKKGE